MAANHQALDGRQRQGKGGVAEQGEETLVEEQHGVERVDHADGVLADGAHQRMIGAVLGQQFQRDDTLVDQINGKIARAQAPIGALLQLIRIEDAHGVTLAAEIVLAQLEFPVGAHAAPVHNGDARLARAAPGAIAGQQLVQDARARRHGLHLVALGKTLVDWQLTEDGAERVAKGQAARAFGVVFNEIQRGVLTGGGPRVREIKGVQASAVIAGAARGFQGQQRILRVADAQAGAQGIVGQQVVVGFAQRAAQDARRLEQIAVGARREEVRP